MTLDTKPHWHVFDRERPLVVWDAIGQTYRRLRDSQETP
jgi:hypothetical protein